MKTSTREMIRRLRAGEEPLTLIERYDPATLLRTREEASEYLDALVEWNLKVTGGEDRDRARAIERKNLAYFATLCGPEVRVRVERLFNTRHPVVIS